MPSPFILLTEETMEKEEQEAWRNQTSYRIEELESRVGFLNGLVVGMGVMLGLLTLYVLLYR